MSDIDEDLKATRDDLIDEARRLEQIEREKASLEPTDPRIDSLSAEAEVIAARVLPKTRVERELTEEVRGSNR